MNHLLVRVCRVAGRCPWLLAVLAMWLPWAAFGGTKPRLERASPAFADFALLDHRGGFHQLSYYAKDAQTRAIVLFVQGNGCPLVRKRTPELKRLRDAYAAKGVVFWMINPNPQDHRDEVAKEAAEFEMDLPILLDEAQLVARALEVTRTAEAIVVEPARSTIASGTRPENRGLGGSISGTRWTRSSRANR
jgi:peroxiredoxin